MNDINFKDTSYENGILHAIDETNFPLTYSLVRRNNYKDTDRVRAMYRYGRSEPSAVAIYREKYDDESAITRRRILTFEVSLPEHGRGFGHKLIENFKWDCEEIKLGPGLESKYFYIKEGFEESSDSELCWRRRIY